MFGPYICKCSLDQDQAPAAKETSEETANGETCKALREPRTEDEETEYWQANHVYWNTSEGFAKMGRDDGSKGDSKENERHSRDSSGHRDIEFCHDTSNTCCVSGDPESSGTLLALNHPTRTVESLHYGAKSPGNGGDVDLSVERPVQWVVWIVSHHPVADCSANFHGLRNWLFVKGSNSVGMLHTGVFKCSHDVVDVSKVTERFWKY